MEIGSRRIAHVNVTTSPTLAWVQQQIREATPWDQAPRFLIHEVNGIVGLPVPYGARPSQAIHGIPDPYPELRQPPPRAGRLVALPVLGGVQAHLTFCGPDVVLGADRQPAVSRDMGSPWRLSA